MRSPTFAICLNMIVKNEAQIIEECLSSVVDHIDCWVICDTGSSDGTQALVCSFFAARGIPGILHAMSFANFEQARNEALEFARQCDLRFDYLLLMDADMELVVQNPTFREMLGAKYYRALQKADTTSYWNTRLLRRDALASYRGVTHEYLDFEGSEDALYDLWFVDHANGSNRADKPSRDLRLLRAALEMDQGNARYWFYLAQTYWDEGRFSEAAVAYARRAEMVGFAEETWYAKLQYARCLLMLGDECGFVAKALVAYNERPHRAEPLYDLARFYRQRGLYEVAVLYCEAGLALSWPEDDTLFIDDFIYATGLREELSIAGYYCQNPGRKERGRKACEALAHHGEAPDSSRALALNNLVFYTNSEHGA